MQHNEARLVVEYLRPDRIYAAVMEERADLGLVSYPEATREINVIPWRSEEMVVAASPFHPLSVSESIRPQELAGVDFVGFDEDLPIYNLAVSLDLLSRYLASLFPLGNTSTIFINYLS